ncbi:MAG: hypothetical protein KDB14_16840 [Planctomycetales bacterium]|nr:hypothetical protein [Planctomycetales bacterium]
MSSVPKLVLIGDTLVTLYENMARIRQFSVAMQRAIDEGQADSGTRPVIGLEAMAAGVSWHLTHDDLLFSARPALSIALGKGVEMRELAAQCLRRSTGCGGGMGGGRTFAAPQYGFLGVTEDNAAPMLNALGAAMACRRRKPPPLAVGVFGADGLIDGAYHEALRCAGEWMLPVMFVAHIDRSRDLSPKRWGTVAKTYGIAAVDADGRSVSEVYAAANEAVRRAREGEGPSLLLLEVGTTSANNQLPAEDDPLQVMRSQLLSDKGATREELEEIDQRCEQEVEQAMAYAELAPPVDWKVAGALMPASAPPESSRSIPSRKRSK